MCCRTNPHLYLYYYSVSLMLIYYKLTQIIATGETVIFRILYVISKRGVCLWFLSSHTSFADRENTYSIKVHVPGPWRACTSVQRQGWRLRRGQTVMCSWLVLMNTTDDTTSWSVSVKESKYSLRKPSLISTCYLSEGMVPSAFSNLSNKDVSWFRAILIIFTSYTAMGQSLVSDVMETHHKSMDSCGVTFVTRLPLTHLHRSLSLVSKTVCTVTKISGSVQFFFLVLFTVFVCFITTWKLIVGLWWNTCTKSMIIFTHT